jgi:hypothetical protein
MAKRKGSVVNFLQDLTDDIKDFLDDEVIDRARTAERDVRKAGRNAFDYNDERADSGSRGDDIAELREALKTLSAQVGELAAAKK